jgi:hypothetical protein
MVEVSNVVLKYSEKGAKDVQRADSNVRDSLSETAKTAQEESGTLDRWMKRHQTAIAGIAAATLGMMAAVIKSSPVLSAELSTMRMYFSLIAMEIGNNLRPEFQMLTGAVEDLYEFWDSLDDDTQRLISLVIGFGAAISAAAVAVGALAKVLGPLVGPLKSLGGLFGKAAGYITGFLQAFAAIFAVGIGAWVVTQITYLKILIGSLGKVRGATVFLLTGIRNLARAAGFSSLVAGFQALIKWARGATTASALLGAAWRSLWTRILAIPVIGTLASWVSAFVVGVAAILGVSTTLVAGVLAAIAIITAIGIWTDPFDTIHKTLNRMWGRLVSMFDAWATVLSDLFSDTWGVIQAIFDDEKSVTVAVYKLFKNLIVNVTKALVETVIHLFMLVVESVYVILAGFVSGVYAILAGLWNEMKLVFNKIVSMIPTSFEELKSDVVRLWDATVQKVIDLAYYLWDVLVGNSIIPDMVDDIVDSFKSLDIDVRAVVSKMVASVVGFFGNLRTKVSAKTKKLYTSVTDRMSKLYTGVTGSLSSLASDATSTVGGLHDNVSSKFYSLKSTVISTTSDLSENATTSVGSMASSILGDADKMASGVVSDIRDMASSAVDEVRGMDGDISSRLSDLTRDARSWGRDMMMSFRDQISRYSSRVSRTADSLAREISRSLDLERDANRWGRDIGRELSSGLRSARSNIDSAGDSLRRTIERHLSFDRIDNDRAARRWGSDFVQEWSKGLQSEWSAFERGMPSMDASMSSMTPGSGGTSTSSTTVNIEQGAIQIRGGRAVGGKIDESELADEVADRFGSQVGGRTR